MNPFSALIQKKVKNISQHQFLFLTKNHNLALYKNRLKRKNINALLRYRLLTKKVSSQSAWSRVCNTILRFYKFIYHFILEYCPRFFLDPRDRHTPCCSPYEALFCSYAPNEPCRTYRTSFVLRVCSRHGFYSHVIHGYDIIIKNTRAHVVRF